MLRNYTGRGASFECFIHVIERFIQVRGLFWEVFPGREAAGVSESVVVFMG